MTPTSILDGVDVTTLQARLTALQTAYLELSSGAKVVTASYTQGDGARTVSFTQARIQDLVQAILTVQRQIDVLNGVSSMRRAPLVPFFRG